MDGLSPDRAEHRRWLHSLIDYESIGSLLDVGCGIGRDVLEFARRNEREDARLLGIDASAKAIHLATQAAADDPRVTFMEYRVANSLPFDDASFDVVFSADLLECIGNRSEFLRDVARVLRPSGQVVFAHWDWDTLTFDGPDKGLVRRAVHRFADMQQKWMDHCDGWMGRRLWSAFQATGLFEGSIQAHVLVNTSYEEPLHAHMQMGAFESLVKRDLMTSDDYAALMSHVERAAAANQFFYSLTSYAYVGTKR